MQDSHSLSFAPELRMVITLNNSYGIPPVRGSCQQALLNELVLCPPLRTPHSRPREGRMGAQAALGALHYVLFYLSLPLVMTLFIDWRGNPLVSVSQRILAIAYPPLVESPGLLCGVWIAAKHGNDPAD